MQVERSAQTREARPDNRHIDLEVTLQRRSGGVLVVAEPKTLRREICAHGMHATPLIGRPVPEARACCTLDRCLW